MIQEYVHNCSFTVFYTLTMFLCILVKLLKITPNRITVNAV